MPNDTVQEIKDRLNLAEVIGGYIPIKKAGTNFKALCPFHSEKTASLQISPQKQIWHCFGCGEGGDVFGFVMRYENLDFKDALKLLAEKAGVQLPVFRPRDTREQDEKELLFRINDFAARFYHQVLVKEKHAAMALQYLKQRGLNEATVQKWQIGFAPNDFHSLEEALAKKGVSAEAAAKSGVLTKNEQGKIYDRFRGRITFPIFDYLGEVAGFSARILPELDDGQSGKYINSPETLVYNKSKILFGLNFAKTAIRKKDEAVVVEGQMDCIALHQAGFNNVVASSGTALTVEQLQRLGRLTKNLKFCFDADSAGQQAALRAGELALRQGFRLKLILLKAVKDPDELVRKSPGLWEKAVAEAVWFLDFLLALAKEESPEDSVSQLHYVSSRVVPLLGLIQDPLEQEHYLKKITEEFGVSERTLKQQIKPAALPASQTTPAKFGKLQNFILEKEVLGGALMFPEYLEMISKESGVEDFEHPEIRELLKSLFSQPSAQTIPRESTLAKEASFMVESQLDDLEGDQAVLRKQLMKSFALFKLGAIKRQQAALHLEIKRAETAKDNSLLAQLNDEFARAAVLRLKYEKLA